MEGKRVFVSAAAQGIGRAGALACAAEGAHVPDEQALRRAQFEFEAGEVHALMGENGAGRSTLMKILAGISQPTAGEIVLDLRQVVLPSPRAAQDHGIAIIHSDVCWAKQ